MATTVERPAAPCATIGAVDRRPASRLRRQRTAPPARRACSGWAPSARPWPQQLLDPDWRRQRRGARSCRPTLVAVGVRDPAARAAVDAAGRGPASPTTSTRSSSGRRRRRRRRAHRRHRTRPADAIRAAFAAGKHVVTANKALLARAGPRARGGGARGRRRAALRGRGRGRHARARAARPGPRRQPRRRACAASSTAPPTTSSRRWPRRRATTRDVLARGAGARLRRGRPDRRRRGPRRGPQAGPAGPPRVRRRGSTSTRSVAAVPDDRAATPRPASPASRARELGGRRTPGPDHQARGARGARPRRRAARRGDADGRLGHLAARLDTTASPTSWSSSPTRSAGSRSGPGCRRARDRQRRPRATCWLSRNSNASTWEQLPPAPRADASRTTWPASAAGS